MVQSVELLDENFTPVPKTLNISFDRAVCLREVNSSEPTDSYASDIVFKDDDTQIETTLQNTMFRRLGKSSVFLTDLISIVSPDPPLAMAVPGSLTTTPPHWSSFMARQAMAGTVSPGDGSYQIQKRRGTSTIDVQKARTRMVTITSATSNFDGITPSKDRISANVKWGAQGYVATKLINVSDSSIFTFDVFDGIRVTTDLGSISGLALGPERLGLKSDPVSSFPQSPSDIFKALVGSNQVVRPGLYRIRAKWSPYPGLASMTITDPNCDTDHPERAICVDDWIVSVGERILLTAETSAQTDLANTYFPQVYVAPRTPPAVNDYLSQVAATATQAYVAAGANVLVSTDTNLLHPYMTHTIKSTVPIPSDCVDSGQVENFIYGCTNNAAKFPLTDPDLDLASTPKSGLNLNTIYRGIARGPIGGGLFGWVDNLSKQPRNSDPSSWSAGNPSPDVIFLNRMVNVTVYEMAHGFGLVSGKPYLLHGAPPLPATMHAVDGKPVQTIGGLTWVETDSTGDLRHEPILDAQTAQWINDWIMQAGPFHWRYEDPAVGDSYDTPIPPALPQRWLALDRPLRFSLTSDWGGSTDRSIQQFFRERLPVCATGQRNCR